ncbi:hypothetical protein GCM10010251_86810 [Streptomyces aurantiogriseus]|uniref:Uncharacterized protein n=1 Tax=Streptomyces aurantiogriseus TaxID=66870 RepID=A0A918KZN5_9ACTN|nr:hypothetical protein GCM10010251_86810 [Streptomyces aurantiogriseus]
MNGGSCGIKGRSRRQRRRGGATDAGGAGTALCCPAARLPGCPAARDSKVSFAAICRPSTGTSAASDVPPSPCSTSSAAARTRPSRPGSLQLSRAAFDSKLADEVLEKGIENALAFIY